MHQQRKIQRPQKRSRIQHGHLTHMRQRKKNHIQLGKSCSLHQQTRNRSRLEQNCSQLRRKRRLHTQAARTHRTPEVRQGVRAA
jgi:hypothetical protein